MRFYKKEHTYGIDLGGDKHLAIALTSSYGHGWLGIGIYKFPETTLICCGFFGIAFRF